jgi:hypothetical protein
MRYLLNSAVITAPGRYDYQLQSPEEATAWMTTGTPPRSTIGYASTAELLSSLTGQPVAVNRTPCTMEPGDEALVIRFALEYRLPAGMKTGAEGRKDAEDLFRQGKFELGLLRRLPSP